MQIHILVSAPLPNPSTAPLPNPSAPLPNPKPEKHRIQEVTTEDALLFNDNHFAFVQIPAKGSTGTQN